MCKSLIIFGALFTSSCLAEIKISEHNESVLVEAVVKILESCYENRITAVGLAGNSTGLISEALWHQGSSPITLTDGTARETIDGPVNPQFRYRLQVFVITASSSMDLSTTLNEIKTSIWWNHMAAFLVLDWQLSSQGCKNAFEILWTTWEMNLLNAKFLCHHWTKGRLIYTFNPYTNWAPKPWQLDKSYTGKNHQPWTLFVRRYEEDHEETCNKLDFDKANDLGGHQIRVSSTTLGHEIIKPNPLCPGVFENILCEILFPALNATPKVLVHDSVNIGFVDAKGNVNGMLGEVVNGLSDFAPLGRYLAILNNFPMMYPFYQTGLHALTQYSGYKSQLSKIRSAIDSSSRYGFCLVLLVTVLFFKYAVRQSLPTAHLSTFRIICNTTLPKIPGKLGPRIYLGSLFLFAITMQGIFQSQLAALLSRQKPLGSVNTMKDLAKLGHMIHGQPLFRLYFGDPVFQGRFVDVRSGTCTEYVLRSSSVACIGTPTNLVYNAIKYKLHMSQKAMVNVLIAIPIRPDWPLEDRLNTLIGRIVQAHLVYYMYDNVNFKTHRLVKFQENQYEDQTVKILSFKQLGFAFVFLGIGLSIATISFIIEMVRSSWGRIFGRKFNLKSVLRLPLVWKK